MPRRLRLQTRQAIHLAENATNRGLSIVRVIYDASIIQAAGRSRPLERTADNPSISYVFANVALPFPVDSVSRWRDARPDRLVRMVASEAVWTNSVDMATFRPDLFVTAKAAEIARSRFAGTISDMREAVQAIVRNDTRPWVQITYQVAGQGHKQRFIFAPEGAEAAVRHAIEAEYGRPVTWRVRTLTYGHKDSLDPVKSISYLGMRDSSREPTADIPSAWMLPRTPLPAPGDGAGPA